MPALALVVLRFVDPPRTAFMLQTLGEPGCERIDFTWIDADALPGHVGWSALAAEDQGFFEHSGFDYGSIRQALSARADGERLRGASTISQQVAKNLFLWSGRSWLRKGFEAYLTVWLELLWSKQRILEVYLNIAQFGRCTFGVEAASRQFFGKSARWLTAEESALLMTALPSPTRRRPDAPSAVQLRRMQWIRAHARTLERVSPRDAWTRARGAVPES